MRRSELKEDSQQFESQLRVKKVCDICLKTQQVLEPCQRCKRALCSKCCQKENNGNKTCSLCLDEIHFIASQIVKNKLQWGKQSIIGEQWAQSFLDKYSKFGFLIENKAYKSYINRDFQMLDTEYQQLIQSIQKSKESFRKSIPSFDKACQDIEVLSLNGSGLNYSFKDLIIKTGFLNKEGINAVKNILLTFSFTRQEVGYSSQMKNLAFFLLCFMQESLAYYCFLKIYTEILPEKVWPSNINHDILKKRIKDILSISLKFNFVNKSESIRLKYEDFLSKNLLSYYSSFLIGAVSYKETFYYFNNLVKEKSISISFCLLKQLIEFEYKYRIKFDQLNYTLEYNKYQFYSVDEFVIIISLINYEAIVNEQLYLHEFILFNTSSKKINNLSIQLNEFLDNINSNNEVYSKYKENQKLSQKKEKLVQLLCQLQIEQTQKQNHQSQLESEIDMTKFVTEIGTHSVLQEEKKLENNNKDLKSQLEQLEKEENDLKESISIGKEEIQKLLETKAESEESTILRNGNREIIEIKYLNKQNQMKRKIKMIQDDLKQYEQDIAARTKILEARKKQLLKNSKIV